MSISMAKLIESPSHIIYLFDYYHFKQSDSSEGMNEEYAETSTWNIDKLSQVNEEGCYHTNIQVHLVRRNYEKENILSMQEMMEIFLRGNFG